MSSLRELNDKLDLSKRFDGYFSKWVFRVVVIAVAVLAFFAFKSIGFSFENHPYYTCGIGNNGNPCPVVEWLPKGCQEKQPGCTEHVIFNLKHGETYGTPPPAIVENFDLYAFLILVVGFVVNHVLWSVRSGKLWFK